MSKAVLRTEGASIVDGDGNVVILRGVSFHNGAELLKATNAIHSIDCARWMDVDGEFHEWVPRKRNANSSSSRGGSGQREERILLRQVSGVLLHRNYHHFEDDMNPMVIKEEGFKHVDRVVALVCTRSRSNLG
jgi:endoglucanase